VSWLCAAWYFWKSSGLLSTSGVTWMEPTLARASVTPISTFCSWAA
jgi:hypothetical protein